MENGKREVYRAPYCIGNVKRKSKPLTVQQEKDILEKQDYRCFYCRERFGEYQKYRGKLYLTSVVWDHLVPFAYQMDESPDNFVAACRFCNAHKHSVMFDDVKDLIRHVLAARGYYRDNPAGPSSVQ